ncbi:MAG: LacI family DNA-binding transcriptional regulator [Actinobacteria bacterium]|nr:LacI family DNA-binding transcriptional regulator [Actinomycetota bacterium]
MSGDEAGAIGHPAEGEATMADVAALAEVSPATVSRYLQGKRVRDAERVAAAVEQLQYRPNQAARGLRSRTTGAVAVVVRDIGNPYAASLVAGIQSVAGDLGFPLYLAGGVDHLDEIVDNISPRVDAIVCAATLDRAVLDALRRARKPTVLVEFEPAGEEHEFDVVVVDNAAGAEAAVGALIDLGHRSIGVVAGPDGVSVARERLEGAEAAVEKAREGVTLAVERTDFSFAGGRVATGRLLDREEPPTAIFACNNLTAIGTLQCIQDRRIPVPEQLSFIGFDPFAHPDLVCPAPPSTVDRPEEAQGALAMRLLEGRMSGRGAARPRRIVLETTLVLRGSTGAPPDRRADHAGAARRRHHLDG